MPRRRACLNVLRKDTLFVSGAMGEKETPLMPLGQRFPEKSEARGVLQPSFTKTARITRPVSGKLHFVDSGL